MSSIFYGVIGHFGVAPGEADRYTDCATHDIMRGLGGRCRGDLCSLYRT